MTQDRMDRTAMALLWSGRYFLPFVTAMAVLVAFAGYNPVPALDDPALHVGGPVALAGLVLWRALGAAGRDSIMWTARINLVIVVLLGAVLAGLLMTGWHQDRICRNQPEGRTCTEVAPPIIRFFNSRRPEYRPDIPANP